MDGIQEFIAIDGEGYTIEEGGKSRHIYNLLAASDGSFIHDNNGLRTRECFDYFITLKQQNPDAIFVSFYFSYDVNMILGNIPYEAVDRLKKQGFTYVYCPDDMLKSYRIEYMARKFFTLYECKRKSLEDSWKRVTTVKIWDVFGFFQSSFIKAVKDFGVGTEEEIKTLTTMKASRADFTTESIDEIIKYNKLECNLLVKLMDQLNRSLINADLELKSWHGAGAVAQQLLTNYEIDKYITPVRNNNYLYPIRCAYFGGRIQALQIGEVRQTVYTHDLVSAYPNATQYLPSLRKLGFKHLKTYDSTIKNCIWRVRWNLPETTVICPFPFRLKDGRIDYPYKGEGYYWGCEVSVAMKYYSDYIDVVEGFQFVINDELKPFDFVPELFEKRKRYKKEGNQAQYAIKLALNSLYGKMAQSEGNAKFQCYLWAGMITADTRARMLDLAMEHPNSVIAFATDGLISKEKHCENGNGTLGSWEVETYHSLFIIKPGFYTGRNLNGKTTRKVRGFMPKEVSFSSLRKEWRVWHVNGAIPIPCNRFIGMKATTDYSNWRTWEKGNRLLSMLPSVGLPERTDGERGIGKKGVVYNVIGERYDGVSKAYDGTFFDEFNYEKSQIEQETWG